MRIFSRYFWGCLIVFTVNQFIEKLGVHIPYVHAYLDDVLSAGIVLGFALAFQQQLTFAKVSYLFSKWHVVFYVLWYSLLFEVVFPYFDARHHADVFDVLAYAVGGVGFYWLGNKPTAKVWFRPIVKIESEP